MKDKIKFLDVAAINRRFITTFDEELKNVAAVYCLALKLKGLRKSLQISAMLITVWELQMAWTLFGLRF